MIEVTLRHVPTQARSRARLESVLAAAETILVGEGAAALTTKRVAAVARVPVGSVYHLFGDKEDIVAAIALRAWSDLAGRLRELADRNDVAPLEEPAAAMLDELVAGVRPDAAFRALWFSPLRTERLREVTRPWREAFGREVERVLSVHWPAASPSALHDAARAAVLAGDAMLREAFRLDADGDPTTIKEGTLMITSYLEARL